MTYTETATPGRRLPGDSRDFLSQETQLDSSIPETTHCTGFRSAAEILGGKTLAHVARRQPLSNRAALNPVTLADVFRLEPRAKALVERAHSLESCHFYGHPYGVNSLWRDLKTCAGWYAAHPELQSSAAYDVLFKAVWDAVLPGACIDCLDSAGELEW